MVEDERVKIDKFNGQDFSFWKMQIEYYIYQKKLNEPLSESKLVDMKQEDWELLDW